MSESDQNILVMEGISKAFPGVQALDDVSLTSKEARFSVWWEKTARGSPP